MAFTPVCRNYNLVFSQNPYCVCHSFTWVVGPIVYLYLKSFTCFILRVFARIVVSKEIFSFLCKPKDYWTTTSTEKCHNSQNFLFEITWYSLNALKQTIVNLSSWFHFIYKPSVALYLFDREKPYLGDDLKTYIYSCPQLSRKPSVLQSNRHWSLIA